MFLPVMLILMYFFCLATPTSAEVKTKSSESTRHYNLAKRYQQSGNLADAVTEYKLAIANTGDEPTFFYGLATVLQAQHDLDDAIINYAEAVRLNPENKVYRQSLDAAERNKTMKGGVYIQKNGEPGQQLLEYEQTVDAHENIDKFMHGKRRVLNGYDAASQLHGPDRIR